MASAEGQEEDEELRSQVAARREVYPCQQHSHAVL